MSVNLKMASVANRYGVLPYQRPGPLLATAESQTQAADRISRNPREAVLWLTRGAVPFEPEARRMEEGDQASPERGPPRLAKASCVGGIHLRLAA